MQTHKYGIQLQISIDRIIFHVNTFPDVAINFTLIRWEMSRGRRKNDIGFLVEKMGIVPCITNAANENMMLSIHKTEINFGTQIPFSEKIQIISFIMFFYVHFMSESCPQHARPRYE